MDPLELLQREVADRDQARRVAALGRVALIASGLGAEGTRERLLPYLDEVARDEDTPEEVQAAIARGLALLLPHMGGDEHVGRLVPLLEFLCAVDETVVREDAARSFSAAIPRLPAKDALARALPAVRRMAASDWWTSRLSVCSVVPAAYSVVPDDARHELRAMYLQLVADAMPMVRAAALNELPALARLLPQPVLVDEFMIVLRALARDDMEGARVSAVPIAAAFVAQMDEASSVELLLPLVESLRADASWRVRRQVARSLPEICRGYESEAARARLVAVFVALIADRQQQVRHECVLQLVHVAAACPREVTSASKSESFLLESAADPSEQVRLTLANSLGKVAIGFGKDSGIAETVLLPVLEELARDELAGVRYNVVVQLDELISVIDEDVATKEVLPIVAELAGDPKWRVRGEVVCKVGMLSRALGQRVFEDKLQQLVKQGLSDHVFSIRESASEQIGELVGAFGTAWAVERVFPAAVAVFQGSTNYLHRMTALSTVRISAKHMDADAIDLHLVPLAVSAASDLVANVRLAAANTILELSRYVSPASVSQHLVPALEPLLDDKDNDVKHAAGVASEACKSRAP